MRLLNRLTIICFITKTKNKFIHNSVVMCDQNNLETFQVNTPIGVFAIAVCSVGVHRLSLLESHSQPNLEIKVVLKDQNVWNENKLVNDSIEWLSDYFEFGQQKGVPVPPFCPNVIKCELRFF